MTDKQVPRERAIRADAAWRGGPQRASSGRERGSVMRLRLEHAWPDGYLLAAPDGRIEVFYSGWDFPSLAANFGFYTRRPLDPRAIEWAARCLDAHVGESCEDLGYFEGDEP